MHLLFFLLECQGGIGGFINYIYIDCNGKKEFLLYEVRVVITFLQLVEIELLTRP